MTYVPAAVPGGIASSLQLFVNGALWTERFRPVWGRTNG